MCLTEKEFCVLHLQEPHLYPKVLTHPSEQTAMGGRQVLSDNLITGNGENRVSLGEGSPLLLRKQLF